MLFLIKKLYFCQLVIVKYPNRGCAKETIYLLYNLISIYYVVI